MVAAGCVLHHHIWLGLGRRSTGCVAGGLTVYLSLDGGRRLRLHHHHIWVRTVHPPLYSDDLFADSLLLCSGVFWILVHWLRSRRPHCQSLQALSL